MILVISSSCNTDCIATQLTAVLSWRDVPSMRYPKQYAKRTYILPLAYSLALRYFPYPGVRMTVADRADAVRQLRVQLLLNLVQQPNILVVVPKTGTVSYVSGKLPELLTVKPARVLAFDLMFAHFALDLSIGVGSRLVQVPRCMHRSPV